MTTDQNSSAPDAPELLDPVAREALTALDLGAADELPPDDLEAGAAQLVGELEKLETFELLDMVLEGAHATLAPAWPIRVRQRQAVARAWSRWADRVLPGYLQRYGDLAVAVTITAMAIAPHVNSPRFAPGDDAPGA